MTIQEFLTTKEGKKYCRAEWARRIHVTRGYFSQLAQGGKTPSLALAVFIERLTGGKVTCEDWDTEWPVDGKPNNVDNTE